MATDPKVLRKFECFRQLSDEQVEAIAKISNSICYPTGHILFEEGETAELIYLLIEGDVDVYNKSAKGRLERVDTISSEEVVGCSAMLSPNVYTATEKTLNDVEVLEINIEELHALIEKDPQMGLRIQEHIIKILNNRILELRHRAFN